MLPSLYISHGSPMIAIMKHEVSDFLRDLPSKFPTPKGIIIISAHWQSNQLSVLNSENPKQIYDFYGFPKELYEVKYPLKKASILSDKVFETLSSEGLHVSKDNAREGYDHGVWVPLYLMYPKANIPVVQISLPYQMNEKELYDLGESLKEFRKDNLIIGSGSLTHNLRDINWDENAPVKEYAKVFRDWISQKVSSGDTKSLLDFKNIAPYVRENHPTLEHFLPLFFALGASSSKQGEMENSHYLYSNQAMDTIVFD